MQRHNIRWTPDLDRFLSSLWSANVSVRTIAGCLNNASRNAVIGRARRLGLPPHKGRPTKLASIQQFKKARKLGLTWHQVAEKFGYADRISAQSSYCRQVANEKAYPPF